MSKKDIEHALMVHEAKRQTLIDRARTGNVIAFTKYTKPDYHVGWHHRLTGRYLTKFVRREPGYQRVIFLEPPRHGKSELTSRRVPALIHGMYPNDEVLAMSYNSELASDMTIDVQRIMDRQSYKDIFPNSRITPEGKLSKYARSSNEHELLPIFGTDVGPFGSYRSAGVNGSFTGRGGNWGLIDDPVKNRRDADSKAFRDELWKFYTSSFRTRMEGFGSILVTETPWHVDDLVGRLTALQKADPNADQWVVIKLPALKENNENAEDPRKIGEPLWPEKFSIKDLLSTKSSIGSREWSALYQVRPTAEGGNIIQSHWIKTYKVRPTKFDQMIQVWDFATKDKQNSDFAVGQVWGRVGANKYLLYQVRGRWDFPTAVKKVLEVSRMFPNAHKKIIEAKANGPAVIQTLRSTVPGLVECEPYGDKVSRLNAIAPDFESGNVWYPAAELEPWIDDHITELCDFPNGVNDDQVDCVSMAIEELRKAKTLYIPISGHGSGIVF